MLARTTLNSGKPETSSAHSRGVEGIKKTTHVLCIHPDTVITHHDTDSATHLLS